MKILFIFVNYLSPGSGGNQPIGVGSLLTMLSDEYEVDFLDTSFILENPLTRRAYTGHLKNSDIKEQQIFTIESLINHAIQKYAPNQYDILLCSSLTSTYNDTCKIVKAYKHVNPRLFTIFGGIHPTVCPEDVINNGLADAVCIGEGEIALKEFLDHYSSKSEYQSTKNFIFKDKNGDIIRNNLRPHADLNLIPEVNYSVFGEQHFNFSFIGHTYRTIAFELNRGCPFKCAYCVNNRLQELYNGISNHTRFRDLDLSIARLKRLKEKHDLEFVRFIDESFSIMGIKDFRHFSKRYKEEINLPFWVQSAASTLQNEEIVSLLKDMNCAAVTIGVEHGDEAFRMKVLNKKQTDKMIFNAMGILKKYDIRRSCYFMIGLPGETRELAFKSIAMYKKLINEYEASPSSIQCFYPFPGTKLYDLCVEKSYLMDDIDSKEAIAMPALNMPNFSFDEILGLKRTFYAYSVMEEKYYPIVKCCESPSNVSDAILEKISEIHSR